MDPTNLMHKINDLSVRIIRLDENKQPENLTRGEAARQMAELGVELARGYLDLHEWIAKGGFLPDPWKGSRTLSGQAVGFVGHGAPPLDLTVDD